MDWDEIIDGQLSGLKRILAMLVAMAAIGAGGTTLRRRAYYGVLRLLRPAESAARRLVIIAARGLVVALPPRRPARPRPKRRSIYVRPGGTGIVVPYGTAMPDARPPSRTLGFRLFDPPYRIVLRRSPPRTSVPRIASFGWDGPSRSPGPTPRSDTVDTTRLNLRIAALARALEDLPKQALRFARWKARRAAGLIPWRWPLRRGSIPGMPRAQVMRRNGEMAEILDDTDYFAKMVLSADTS
ncbi:hypothetical protein [Mesorhizobium sp. J428]|uniref:hypothetical protein n=1 Tax=Mesorhizobium sp. J428 TaxID=2898440 RepID=UPI002151DF53|nr:hypothetical protein [Mesorhizobium sp. J428]MCR5856954.1 hypothetical protein [Mesorhizobium sp. J428]